jgi:hypothetical protein
MGRPPPPPPPGPRFRTRVSGPRATATRSRTATTAPAPEQTGQAKTNSPGRTGRTGKTGDRRRRCTPITRPRRYRGSSSRPTTRRVLCPPFAHRVNVTCRNGGREGRQGPSTRDRNGLMPLTATAVVGSMPSPTTRRPWTTARLRRRPTSTVSPAPPPAMSMVISGSPAGVGRNPPSTVASPPATGGNLAPAGRKPPTTVARRAQLDLDRGPLAGGSRISAPRPGTRFGRAGRFSKSTTARTASSANSPGPTVGSSRKRRRTMPPRSAKPPNARRRR